MGDKSKMYRKIADNKLMFIGIGVGILFWFLEAAIHALIFYHGRLIDEILAPDPQEILDAGAQDFIQKPFSFETLSKTLKRMLGGQTSN